MEKKESSSQRRQKRESDGLRKKKERQRGERGGIPSFFGKGGSAHTVIHGADFVSLPLRHITIEFRSRLKHCHIKQERLRIKKSHKNTWLEGKKRTQKGQSEWEKKKVQVSVDKKRERRIEKETKKGREEKEGIPSFFGEGGSAHTVIHVEDFVSLPLRHITIECRSRTKHCHIKQEREEKKESQKYVVGR